MENIAQMKAEAFDLIREANRLFEEYQQKIKRVEEVSAIIAKAEGLEKADDIT